MKTFLKLSCLFFFLHFTNNFAQIDPDVQEVINRVNIDSLLKYVNELSGEVSVVVGGVTQTIASRHKNYPGNNIAAQYLREKLESYGLTTYEQSFSATGKNIYAVKTGSDYPTQKYIICGHFDSMPNGATAPGADDNASGTAIVLEAARILKDISTKYTIIFALWDEEEQGLIGSKAYADSAWRNTEDILGVLNFDMIAYDGNGDNLVEVHTRASSLTLSNKMIDINSNYNIGLVTSVVNPGLTASDHSPFWTRNYQAILLIENYFGDFNPRYHTTGDRIQYFNNPYFFKCVKLGLGTFAALADVDNVVPVEMISFVAKSQYGKITLNWSTSTEVNNHGFEIQRIKKDTEDKWLTIGFVEGKGTTADQSDYKYIDNKTTGSGEYVYRLKQIDFDGTFSYSEEVTIASSPTEFELTQNYPNPFNPSTTISYKLPTDGYVELSIFNSLGEELETIVNEYQSAGTYNISYNVKSSMSSGIYFYKIRFNDHFETKKFTVLK